MIRNAIMRTGMIGAQIVEAMLVRTLPAASNLVSPDFFLRMI